MAERNRPNASNTPNEASMHRQGLVETVSDTLTPATSAWLSIVARCTEVTHLFEGCHLSLRVSHAANMLGLPNKQALQQMLLARRLPPFQRLRNWYYVVHLTERFAKEGALSTWALRRGDDPSGYYKLVRVTTGHTWNQVRARGPEWARTMALHVWAPHL